MYAMILRLLSLLYSDYATWWLWAPGPNRITLYLNTRIVSCIGLYVIVCRMQTRDTTHKGLGWKANKNTPTTRLGHTVTKGHLNQTNKRKRKNVDKKCRGHTHLVQDQIIHFPGLGRFKSPSSSNLCLVPLVMRGSLWLSN